MAFLRNLFSRPKPQSHSPAVREADPLAFYLGGDGRLQAVKSSGYITSNALGRTGLGYVAAHAEQYAKAAIASVWANNCIALRADTMARFEWFVRNKHTKDKVVDHALTHALYNSKQNILRVMERRLLIYGELFLKPLHNEHGMPSGFHALNNLDVEVDDSLGYINHFRYTPNGTRQQQTYFPRNKGDYRQQIVYIHNDNEFDDHRGISRFESILLEIGIDVDISRATAAFYKNDARPGLLLIPETDLTLEQSEEFVDFWNAQFKGSQNAGRTALVPKVIKEIREFQRAPSIDDVELRESTRREICAAFKVPLSMAGAWDDATYQSLPEQRKFFYEETMIPAADAHAEDLTKNALPFFDDSGENEVAYDASTILALVENAAEKVDIHTKKLQSGAYTINEYREFNGDDPIDGGDIYLHQSGWIPVRADELATYEAPNTAQAPDPMLEEVPAPNTPQLPANVATRSEPKKKYDPQQPRDSSGQFGSGGGSSGGGGSSDDNGGSDKPKPKPKKPKKPTEDKPKPDSGKPKPQEGKPPWASGEKRNAGVQDGVMDFGHLEGNPINAGGSGYEKSISEGHARNLDPKQKEAVQTYTGESYRDINNGLRGKGELSDSHRDTVAALDKALKQNSLTQPTVLYRGMKMNDALKMQAYIKSQMYEGATFTDQAYTSTSFDQGNPERFAGGADGAVMRIKAPAGTNGMAASAISEFPEEREFLLPRDTQYKITGVTTDPATGKTYIDAEIVSAA